MLYFRFIRNFIFLILYSIDCFSSSSIPISNDFVITQYGDELIDGRKASITWRFNINLENNTALLDISSWHAPFSCEGYYGINQHDGQLDLSWNEKDNSDSNCDIDSPQFIIKMNNDGQWLIKSNLFPWQHQEWQKLRKLITKNKFE